MKSRSAAVLLALLLIGVFGLGVFLLVAADDMPAPGLILCAVAAAFGLICFLPLTRRTRRPDPASELEEHRLRSLAEDQARRLRGEFDSYLHE